MSCYSFFTGKFHCDLPLSIDKNEFEPIEDFDLEEADESRLRESFVERDENTDRGGNKVEFDEPELFFWESVEVSRRDFIDNGRNLFGRCCF